MHLFSKPRRSQQNKKTGSTPSIERFDYCPEKWFQKNYTKIVSLVTKEEDHGVQEFVIEDEFPRSERNDGVNQMQTDGQD